jgi:hypothetical protein
VNIKWHAGLLVKESGTTIEQLRKAQARIAELEAKVASQAPRMYTE